MKHGAVIWLTGLSASGKSTLAKGLCEHLRGKGLPVELLDGDSLRAVFPETGFTKAERDTHIRRVGFMASLLEKHGVHVVASFVSPYREARRFARGLCKNFIEVHLSTPLEECERRDPKGLYAKARRGEIRDFTGVDAPYEPPESPELTIDTSAVSMEEALESLIQAVDSRCGP
ncbi:MAG: adenylyl-sulfate kinase [Elusimicrobiota bacterium]